VKRERIMSIKEQAKARGEAVNEEDIGRALSIGQGSFESSLSIG